MDDDAVITRATVRGDGDLDRRWLRELHTPESGRGPVGSADEASDTKAASERLLLEGDRRPTDAVHAGVHLVEDASSDSLRDHPATEAECVELPTGHQTVVA